MKGTLLLTLLILIAGVAPAQQLNSRQFEIKHPIKTVIQPKPLAGAHHPNWDVYSDFEMTKEVGSVAVGDSVEAIGWSPWLYYIKHNGMKGYVSWRALEVNSRLDSLSKVLQAESVKADELVKKKGQELEKKQQELERKKYEDSLIKLYGKTVAMKILDGQWWVGMTDVMATLSLGRPDDVNRTVTANSVREQWVYRKYNIYLYFTNGVCTSYQE